MTRSFIKSIPKPNVHVYESQKETFESHPLSKQSRPKFNHIIQSVIIDGDSLGKCFELASDKMTWKFFSCQGVTIAMKEALKYPKIYNARERTFTFLPGIRRFPHVAYPHTHDMDYLFDKMN